MPVTGTHLGVLFNDSQIGHGVSLVPHHTAEEESESEGKWGALAALHSNQFVMAVCIWTKVITI